MKIQSSDGTTTAVTPEQAEERLAHLYPGAEYVAEDGRTVREYWDTPEAAEAEQATPAPVVLILAEGDR